MNEICARTSSEFLLYLFNLLLDFVVCLSFFCIHALPLQFVNLLLEVDKIASEFDVPLITTVAIPFACSRNIREILSEPNYHGENFICLFKVG